MKVINFETTKEEFEESNPLIQRLIELYKQKEFGITYDFTYNSNPFIYIKGSKDNAEEKSIKKQLKDIWLKYNKIVTM